MTNVKKVVDKCMSDKDINGFAKVIFEDFYTAARTAVDPTTLFNTPHGALLRNKSTIVYSESSRKAMNQLIGRVEHLLPPAFANRRSLQTNLPDIIANLIEEDLDFKEFRPHFKDFLEKTLSQSYDIFLPNNLFRLNGIRSLLVGPVSIVPVENVAQSVNKVAKNIKANNPNARDFVAKVDAGKLSVNYHNIRDIEAPSSHTMWGVSIAAHPEQAREEALWRIRVACGLISSRGKSWTGPKPYGTRLERHPTVNDRFMGDTLLRMSDSHVSIGGGNIYPPYEITAALKSEIESDY